MKGSHLLAIDTSGSRCSVALSSAGGNLFLCSAADRRHAAELLPMIQTLLEQSSLTLSALDAIAVVSGPGSFTGLRIGTAVTQGLAHGAGVPVIAVSALRVLAQQYIERTPSVCAAVRVCLKARENECYAASFDCRSGQACELGAARVATGRQTLPSTDVGLQFRDWVALGDAWQDPALVDLAMEAGLRVVDANPVMDARDVLVVAQHLLEAGEVMRPEMLQPLYIKDELEYRRVGQ